MISIEEEKMDRWIARSEQLVAEVQYLRRREQLLLETIKLAIVAARGDARAFAVAGLPAVAYGVNERANKLQAVLDEAAGPAQPVAPADAVA